LEGEDVVVAFDGCDGWGGGGCGFGGDVPGGFGQERSITPLPDTDHTPFIHGGNDSRGWFILHGSSMDAVVITTTTDVSPPVDDATWYVTGGDVTIIFGKGEYGCVVEEVSVCYSVESVASSWDCEIVLTCFVGEYGVGWVWLEEEGGEGCEG